MNNTESNERPLGEYLPCTQEQIDRVLKSTGGRNDVGEVLQIGRALVAEGVITEEQLDEAVQAQRFDRLRVCSLFNGIPDEEIRLVTRHVQERTVAEGERFVRQDDRGQSFYIVASGQVEVFREDPSGERFPLATIMPGETVGEMGYFSEGVRSASCEAGTRTELLEIAYANVPRCLEASPSLAVRFLNIVTHRLRETDLRYQTDVTRRRSVERSLHGLSTLLDLGDSLTMQAGIDDLIERVVATASDVMTAERATLFLVDQTSGDLWSKVAEGAKRQTIRVARGSGIAGWVAQTGKMLNIPDAHDDPRFNPEVDKKTGYRTRAVLCGPVRNMQGEIIGVIQVINKRTGLFTPEDETLFRAFAYQAAIAVENFNLYQRLMDTHEKVAIMLDVATAVSQTLDLPKLIGKIINKTTEILGCDRGSLFLLDEETNELWSMEARGAEVEEIRFPARLGLAGHTATTGQIVNVPDAHRDPRFNPRFDKETGYRTRSVLCVPVIGRSEQPIGVVQAINKSDGPFLREDEELLRAMGSQIAVALENAQLYARTVAMKNYLESVQHSISNAIISLTPDWKVVTANRAALALLHIDGPESNSGNETDGTDQEGGGGDADAQIVGRDLRELLGDGCAGVTALVGRALTEERAQVDFDVDLCLEGDEEASSVNVNAVPLHDGEGTTTGAVVVLEDITREKRVKSTLTRYMAKEVVERMLQDPEKQGLGGVRQDATVLFSDIRAFTSLAEKYSAEQTMDFLNDYFSRMVDEVFEHDGVLDKFMGDAMLAVFGVPYAQPDDAVRAVRTALRMLERLHEFNAARVAGGDPAIAIGIGVNSGEVISGNMGSEKRMEFTVIGDGVNVSSRLEGLTKQYGVDILIGPKTRDALDDSFLVRSIDHVRVKGKRNPIEIFQVVGETRDGGAFTASQQRFLQGREAYGEMRFEAAKAHFEAGAEDDPPCRLYVERCEHFLQDPPGDDWDRAWTHTRK